MKQRPLSYDDNGNLTGDGVFSYSWDVEDRLIMIEYTSSVTVSFRKEFRYDYLSRRVQEVYSEFTAGTWQEQYTRRFLYDGFTMVAELLVPPTGAPTVERNFVWGHEVAGGGIGALLLVSKHTGADAGAYYPGYDGRGNVTVLVDADTMAMAAGIEYGPWGDVVRATGAWRATPFLYNTKWSLDQGATAASSHWPIGLYDYGLRLYSPKMGRFLNRDPIGEAGGLNLYQAFGGDPINKSDYLGMNPITIIGSPGNIYDDFFNPPGSSGGGLPGSGWGISVGNNPGWDLGLGVVGSGSAGSYSAGDKFDYYGKINNPNALYYSSKHEVVETDSFGRVNFNLQNYSVSKDFWTSDFTISRPDGYTTTFTPTRTKSFWHLMYNEAAGVIFNYNNKNPIVVFSIYDNHDWIAPPVATPKKPPTLPAAVPATPGAPVVGGSGVSGFLADSFLNAKGFQDARSLYNDLQSETSLVWKAAGFGVLAVGTTALVVDTITNLTGIKGLAKSGFKLGVRAAARTTSEAAAPVGRLGNPMNVPGPQNVRTTIGGREFSGHALDQMQGRGIMPSVVDNTIRQGTNFPTRAGTTGFYDSVNNVRVIVNSETGRVVTVIPGAP